MNPAVAIVLGIGVICVLEATFPFWRSFFSKAGRVPAQIVRPCTPPSATERVDAESQALVYAQQVDAGAKLVATLQVKHELAAAVEATCRQEGCAVSIEKRDGWAYVWIYKYPFVRLLIEEIKRRGSPKSALDTWVNGKLFGYSDYEIARALEREGHIESAIT